MALVELIVFLFEVIAGAAIETVLKQLVKKMIEDLENTGKHNQVQELNKGVRSIVYGAHPGKQVDSYYIKQQLRNSLDELEKRSELQSVRDVKKTLDMLESQGVGKSGHLSSSPLINSNKSGSHNLPHINGRQLATTSFKGPYFKMVVKLNFNCLCEAGCAKTISKILGRTKGFERLSIQDERCVEVVFGTSVDIDALTNKMRDKLERKVTVLEVKWEEMPKGSYNLPQINGRQLVTTSSNGPYFKVQKKGVKMNLHSQRTEILPSPGHAMLRQVACPITLGAHLVGEFCSMGKKTHSFSHDSCVWNKPGKESECQGKRNLGGNFFPPPKDAISFPSQERSRAIDRSPCTIDRPSRQKLPEAPVVPWKGNREQKREESGRRRSGVVLGSVRDAGSSSGGGLVR